jgi:hypothetical protein
MTDVRVRRRVAVVVLALGLVGGGALLTANNGFLAPTANGGEPGDIPIQMLGRVD